jgi:hypothetical protein
MSSRSNGANWEILDTKYEPANLNEVVAACTYLPLNQQEKLKILMKEYETLFDCLLGAWIGKGYDIDLWPDAKPYHVRAYLIPCIHEKTICHSIN